MTDFPYAAFGISERAARAILLGQEPAPRLSPDVADLPINIISDEDGRVLATLRASKAKGEPATTVGE